MSVNNPEIRIMQRAAEKAGRSLLRDFGEVENLQVSQKGPGDFVSAADKRAEEILYENLLRDRPDYGFLMEESGVKEGSKDARFIIDPLDGTSNFLHGIPHWCISIALEVDGKIMAALISDPVKNETFTAVKGGGAFSGRNRLRVSGRDNLMQAMIATGAPRRSTENINQFMKEYQTITNIVPGLRRYGAAALDLAYVAAGRYEGFWERDLKAWDIAAGILMVKEAGGLVSELDHDNNDPLETGHVLAANANLQPELKKTLRGIKSA